MSLKDKHVVLIGASSGMGLATAKAAAEAGAKVTLVSRKPDLLEHAVTAVGAGAQGIVADICNEREIESLFAQVMTVDHLVTAAANLTFSPIQQLAGADAEQIVASKILGPFYAVKHGVSHLSKNGSIVFISGFSAWKPVPGTALIAAVDGALAAFCRSLAIELAPIRVNVMAPGVVETLMWEGVPEQQRQAFFATIREQLPVKRMGTLTDMANAVLYLMQSSFITGTILHVDGGHQLI
jgi:NAD(P)-dependent dehydrogenase (short-subunit alcohol dehydrogenase family)